MTGARKASPWPVLRQAATGDVHAEGETSFSKRTIELRPRTEAAERVVKSICPYCAVGCGQEVYVSDGKIIHIEGDPDSPISRGRLCPKGAATRQLVSSPNREQRGQVPAAVRSDWEELPLDRALDMIADRVKASRDATWESRRRWQLSRTLAIAHLGGATLDNEENYLIKKLFTALGTSRSRTRPAYDTPPPSPVWGPRSAGAARPRSSRTSRTPTAS